VQLLLLLLRVSLFSSVGKEQTAPRDEALTSAPPPQQTDAQVALPTSMTDDYNSTCESASVCGLEARVVMPVVVLIITNPNSEHRNYTPIRWHSLKAAELFRERPFAVGRYCIPGTSPGAALAGVLAARAVC
jgi:hypothetical protein